MTVYSQNLLLIEPTPFDPAVANIWGTLLNTNFALIDSAVAGLLSLSVAGSANVVLTSSNGAADQARNAMFIFSGVLTGNIDVLWPNGITGVFTVKNATTGSFSLSLGVNNGSGSPAGSVVAVTQGSIGIFYSDGTNMATRITASGLGALAVANNLSDVASVSTSLSNLGIGSNALRAITIQNGGSPSGGADGDLYYIY